MPASPVCVAFAAILRLNVPIALLATVLGTAASPFYIPALAAFFGGYRLDINSIETCLQLTLLVGGALVASMATKRLAGAFIRANPGAMTRIAVLAMFLAGIGSMRGMQAHLMARPATSLEYIVMAYLLLFGAEVTGTFLFWRNRHNRRPDGGIDQRDAHHHAGLGRYLGHRVLPLADLFLATSMVAKYTAPGLTKWLLSRAIAAEAGVAVAAPEAASAEPAWGADSDD